MEPIFCTMYLREYGMLHRFGHFSLMGDIRILQAYANQPLAILQGLPPVPPEYQKLTLKQYAHIQCINELLLVFEK